ncbi:nucleoside-diphosphate-sugar epimerase [Lepidopterella palustris CBS 459.81]|uniref:Nucleoside-diphosphate-sugar epimerase n=1 Tax=Lepidopterella palustris CBS 459.81 TaxID=1314670 RepID=A0A8E2JBK8_9PEZI|nr:nucleoside-diphosphate-sugar epimerase [Lepidopterella palustris CBS 459.81]
MHLILTGATGLVGSAVLQNMLTRAEVSRITILSRRPVPMAEEYKDKAKVIIHKDFEVYDGALMDELRDAHGCVWALGIAQSQVSKPEYIKITETYPLAAAKAFGTLHPSSPFTFIYVSGEGATTTPGMLTPFFGRIKGNTESALLKLHKSKANFRPYSLRPGGIDESNHPEIHKYIAKQAAYKRILMPVFNTVWSGMISPSKELGRVMTELALSQGERLEGKGIDGEGRTISNVGFRRIAGI